MIKSIDHMELIVCDVDAHVGFFKKLGFNVLMHTSHHGGSAELQLPGDNQPIIEIHEATGEEVIGINHIALKVDDAAVARLAPASAWAGNLVDSLPSAEVCVAS